MKHISFRTKVEAVVIVLLLVGISASAWTIREGESSSGQIYHGSDDLITNSNGKAWTVTNTNLQSALDDLTSGGTVKLPPGDISITTMVTISNDNIILQGDRNTRLDASGSSLSCILYITNTNNVRVSDIIFDNVYWDDEGASAGSGIVVANSENCTINNNKFNHTGYYAIQLNTETKDCTIFNNRLTNIIAWGINVAGSGHTVSHNKIWNSQADAISAGESIAVYTTYAENILISYNIIDNPGVTGTRAGIHIESLGWIRRITIDNNIVCNQTEYGIRVGCTGSSGNHTKIVTISNNILDRCGSVGIFLINVHENNVMSDVIISENTITDYGLWGGYRRGIQCTSANNVTIQNNIIHTSVSTADAVYGIFANKHANHPSNSFRYAISGNIISDFSGASGSKYFIYFQSVQDSFFTDNIVYSGLTAGGNLGGAYLRIFDNENYVTENGGASTSTDDGDTINHGCSGTPDYVLCTTNSSSCVVSVTAINATTFTVALKNYIDFPVNGVTVYWRAFYIP